MSSKWSLGELRAEYEKMGISYEEVFKCIKTLCIKTLMTVEPQITIATRLAKHRKICPAQKDLPLLSPGIFQNKDGES